MSCDTPVIQGLMGKHDGHLSAPDDGIYHKTDPYPVAVVYETQLSCPICEADIDTAYCPRDGGKAGTLGKYHLQFGGPCNKDLRECKILWLPRQDQLQEMVEYVSPLHLLEYLNNFVTTTESGLFPAGFNSMEQLWLAFVMKERWNKTWNGEAWVDAKD